MVIEYKAFDSHGPGRLLKVRSKRPLNLVQNLISALTAKVMFALKKYLARQTMRTICLIEAVAHFKERIGYYPERVQAVT